jgi:hypothetical protein
VDLPDLTGLDAAVDLAALRREARAALDACAEPGVALPVQAAEADDLSTFLAERLRYLFQQRDKLSPH